MTNSSEGSKKTSKKQSALSAVSAAQLYRDRLKAKQSSALGVPGSGMGASKQHRPRGTSPGGSARKNRKGHRPG